MLRKFGIFTPPISLSRYIVFLLTRGCLLVHKKDQRSESISFKKNFSGMINDSVRNSICERSKVLMTSTFPTKFKSLLFHFLMQFFYLVNFLQPYCVFVYIIPMANAVQHDQYSRFSVNHLFK